MITKKTILLKILILGSIFLSPLQAMANSAIFRLDDIAPALSGAIPQGDKINGHEAVVEGLMSQSVLSQADFLSHLEVLRVAGKIDSFRAFWIANVVLVSAEPDELEMLSRHPDVVSVSDNYPVELLTPVEESVPFITSAGPETGLGVIRAPEVWAIGLDGSGSLVCNIDTGVNGAHAALAAKYRGNHGGEVDACWYDPYFNTPYPEDDHGHGTHTMGTMVGSHNADSVGVAPGAQWIAAGVVSRGGDGTRTLGDILAAFQWAADPDGDPATTNDVPDVVNNSWGIPVGYYPACDETFWGAIDNLEAAGAVCVFAAGNEGPLPASIRTPADRIYSASNAFSVGSIYGYTPDLPISTFSSRGPSGCDSLTIKPEVTAPGGSIRSTDRNGGYSLKSGTSMAAPHVAGAIAILRQFNPSATPDQIKQALMASARDLGQMGEDNDYGWGVIDIRNALNFMPIPAQPVIAPVSFTIPGDGIMLPGEECFLEFNLENLGSSIAGLTAHLSSSNPLVEIASGDIHIDYLPHAETTSLGPWIVRVLPQANLGEAAELHIDIFFQDWTARARWNLVIGGAAIPGIASHDNGEVALSFSNFGQFGLGPRSIVPMGGLGFRCPSDSPDYLKNGSLLLATDSLHVSDAAFSTDPSQTDLDFAPLAGAYPRLIDPGVRSGQDGIAGYDDSAAENPLGLTISQNSYCWIGSEASHFVVLEFVVRNASEQSLSGLYAGIFCDWNTPSGLGRDDVVGYIGESSLGYMANRTTGAAVGVKLLTGSDGAYAAIENSVTLADGFTGAEKYTFMALGSNQTAYETPADYSHLMSAGPFAISPGDSIVVAFALLGGANLAELQANAREAATLYLESSIDDNDTPLPGQLAILANYPNPFNGATRITLSGQTSGDEVVSIYNIEGRLVNEIPVSSGNEITWDATDHDGLPLSSGVYFARLKDGNGPSRKMILLK